MKKAAIVGVLLLFPLIAEGAGFKVIVHKSNPTSSLSSADLAALMMKKKARWADGTPVVPVDQLAGSDARAKFSTAVLGKSVDAVRSYWRQQIFSGLETPPLEKRNDEEVVEYVRNNRGAVSYVSEAAITNDVKVVSVQ